MTTVYPGAIDALTNPTGTDQLSSPSHADQHADANDALEAIETELGVTPSGAFATVASRLTTGGNGIQRTAGDFTTTSTTFVDVTGASVTITTGVRRCLIVVSAVAFNDTTNGELFLTATVDGTNIAGSNGFAQETQINGNTDSHNLSFSVITDPLTAASHTFKLQMKVSSGTGSLRANASNVLRFHVQELL